MAVFPRSSRSLVVGTTDHRRPRYKHAVHPSAIHSSVMIGCPASWTGLQFCGDLSSGRIEHFINSKVMVVSLVEMIPGVGGAIQADWLPLKAAHQAGGGSRDNRQH